MRALKSQKKSFVKTLLSISSLVLTTQVLALVDYTDSSEYRTTQPSVKKSAPRITKRARPSKRGNTGGKSYFEFSSIFSNSKYQAAQREGKFDRLDLNAKINTDYKFFLDLSYPMYSGRISSEQKDTSYQGGNPKMIIGLNWFEFGNGADALSIDMLAGLTFKGSSEFASKRTDKIVGVSTSKRIYNVGLSFGLNYTFTGSSDEVEAVDIGNIQSLFVEAGIIISPDIAFMLKAENIQIKASNDLGRSNRLEENIKYSVISPKMKLKMSHAVDLIMQASFRMRRPKSEELSTGLGIWDLEGAYGNSIGAGLEINI